MTRAAAALAAAALLFLGPAACSQIAGLDKLDFNSTGQPCTSASECADTNPCTDDACSSEGICVQTPVADGPVATQTTGDCKVATCSAGKLVNENDDTDILNDSEDCTTDGCSDGTPTNTAKTDGTACMLGGASGACSFGKCLVTCGPGLPPCDDKNPCTDDTCDAATMLCPFAPLADGTPTPGATDMAGDCVTPVCMGGVATNAPADTDLPVDGNPCTMDICTAGVPSHSPEMAGFLCQTGGVVCDGSGSCVACNIDTDCPGVPTECTHPSCTSHVCGTTNTPSGFVLVNQTAGNCQTEICDGNGGITSTANDMDLPADDGNQCTGDICIAGAPAHPPKAAGTLCGNNNMQMCDAMGQCVCVVDTDCASPQTCGGGGTPGVCGCIPKTCVQLGKTCGSWPDGCGGMRDCDNNTKDGTETDRDCGGSAAGTCGIKCNQGDTCLAGTDCSSGFCVDGVCCNTACNGLCDACSAAAKGQNPNGKCGLALAGTVCVAASCATATTVNVADTCTAAGTCMNNGTMSCLSNYACVAGACKTSCTLDSHCASTAYCSGSMCVPKKAAGLACTGTGNQCVSGFCIDGYCCNSVCNTTCKACNVAGSFGTCSNVANGASDPITCLAPNTCDGAGVCKKPNGGTCSLNTECQSAICVDGYCCNSTCTTACHACNVAGSLGTCSNVADGQADTCVAPAVCIAGVCQ